jgi:hypothetical protein
MMRQGFILTAAAALLLGGCNDFPSMGSRDRHHFVATPHTPLNVDLVDTMTGQTVWKAHVPANYELIMDLDHPENWTAGLTPSMPATSLAYQVRPLGGTMNAQPLEHSIKLSGNPVIIKVTKLDPPPRSVQPIGSPLTPAPVVVSPKTSYGTPPPPKPRPVAPTPTVVPIPPPAKPASPTGTPAGQPSARPPAVTPTKPPLGANDNPM